MSKRIYKFGPLGYGLNIVAMPVGAGILTAAKQDDTIRLWAEVEDNKTTESREIFVIGTGHEFPEGPFAYIATVHMDSGLVWHVYEVGHE